MIYAVWRGILTGLVLATFVGPVFLAIINLGLKGHIKGVAYLAFGTFISHALWVLFIYLLARNVDQRSMAFQGMYWVGARYLLYLVYRTGLEQKEKVNI